MYKNNFCSIEQIDKNIKIIKQKLDPKKIKIKIKNKIINKRILIKKLRIRKN